MKLLTPIAVCFMLIFGGFAALNRQHTFLDVNAQETLSDSVVKARSHRDQSDRSAFEVSLDRPYPTFFVDDVITRLTSVAEELIGKKLTRNADELRKNLDRLTFSVKLAPASTKELSTRELYRRASESVFLVAGLTRPTEKETAWKTSFSTAFVVHEDGVLSTSAHVFDHEDHDDAVVAMDIRGNVYPVLEILAANRAADTLLFQIGAKGLKPLPLGPEAAPGSPVRIMGHPGDSFFFFSAGHLANYERDEDRNFWLNVTADFGQGSSGGPVMDEAGNVIGQVSRTYTLYAGGESSNRTRRRRTTRQKKEAEANENAVDAANDDKSDSSKKADPQMVFKACTPVSAIRALVK